MKANQILEIRLVDEGGKQLKISDIYFRVYLFIHERFRYCFTCGPTDNAGMFAVKYSDLDHQRMSSQTQSPMDFNTPLDVCDDRIKIAIPSGDDLIQALEVATRWAGEGTTPASAEG